MKSIRIACLVLPGLLLLAGCATTPSQRIEKNQALFDTLPLADRARIRGGQIDLGYTPDMVRLAFGEPQRRQLRRTAEGQSEIWFYLDTLFSYERQRAEIDGLNVYTGGGSLRSTGGSAWINVMQKREVVRVRVEFQNGVVAAIEELAPN
jgi:hypothetical protein